MAKRHKRTGASAVVSEIERYLFEKDDLRLQKRVLTLVQENHQFGGSPDGFLFKGVFYNNVRSNIVSKVQKGSLMPEMEAPMQQYIDDVRKVHDDRTKVRQMLANLILPCKTHQDIRDALPEILVENYGSLKQLPRTREEGFTLTTDLLRRQYDEFKSLIDIYLVTRMFL